MKNTPPLLAHLLALSLFSLSLAVTPALHAKAKEKPALLCEHDGQMKPCEDSQSDKVADKGKPRAFKAQGDAVTDKTHKKVKAKAKAKKKTQKARKAAAVE